MDACKKNVGSLLPAAVDESIICVSKQSRRRRHDTRVSYERNLVRKRRSTEKPESRKRGGVREWRTMRTMKGADWLYFWTWSTWVQKVLSNRAECHALWEKEDKKVYSGMKQTNTNKGWQFSSTCCSVVSEAAVLWRWDHTHFETRRVNT